MDVRAPVTDLCELSRGCWGLNPGLLKKQQVLLTSVTSLQPLQKSTFHCCCEERTTCLVSPLAVPNSMSSSSFSCRLLSSCFLIFLYPQWGQHKLFSRPMAKLKQGPVPIDEVGSGWLETLVLPFSCNYNRLLRGHHMYVIALVGYVI